MSEAISKGIRGIDLSGIPVYYIGAFLFSTFLKIELFEVAEIIIRKRGINNMRAGYISDIKSACFLDDMPEPQINENQRDWVKVRVKCCGICGSEVHAYHGVHPFRIPPLVSGHEAAGDVIEIGPDVHSVKIGDRVAVEPHYGCGKCWYCRHGMYNVCTNKKVLGSGGWSGALGEYFVTPESTILPLPDSMSYEEGALIEPIANGMYAVKNSDIDENTTICIIGAGPIGIGDVLCARLFKPKKIIISDVVDFNLEKAKKMAPEIITVNSRREDLFDIVMQETDGIGTDYTFMAFGDQASVSQGLSVTRRCGTVNQHAIMPDGIGFAYNIHQQHELNFKAYNMYKHDDFEDVCSAISNGKMVLDHFITQRYPIEDFKNAMIMADERHEPVLKVMMVF